jgi:DNA-binding transcriptional ArsR family regulator
LPTSTPSSTAAPAQPFDADAVLPESVPVVMPALPLRLSITTARQFQAFSDPLRSRILGIIQNQPATAKQIADQLGKPPSTVGHHLAVLEETGLAQVVARRLVRGIVAKYYTRTARIFNFELPPEVRGERPVSVDIMTHVRDELAEAIAEYGEETDDAIGCSGFPHARIAPERARHYQERLDALMEEFIAEPFDPNGEVYGLGAALFVAPGYLQHVPDADSTETGDNPDPGEEG